MAGWEPQTGAAQPANQVDSTPGAGVSGTDGWTPKTGAAPRNKMSLKGGDPGSVWDFAKGAWGGLSHSIGSVLELASPNPVDDPSVQFFKGQAKQHAPTTPMGEWGRGTEQFGEYFVPLPGAKEVEGGIKLLPSLTKRVLAGAAKDAVHTGVVAGAQSNFAPGPTVAGAVVGGVGGAAGRTVSEGVQLGWNKMADLTSDNPATTGGRARIKATNYADQKGIPITPGARTGNEALKQVAKSTSASPLAIKASENAKAADAGYEQTGADILSRLPGARNGGAPLPSDAGENVFNRLVKQHDVLKGLENRQWNGITATQQFTGVGVNVDRGAMQAQLQPVYDQLKDVVGIERDPSFQALQEFMEMGKTKTTGTPPITTQSTTIRSVTPPPQTAPATRVNVTTGGQVTPQGGTALPFSSGSTSSYLQPGVKQTIRSSTTPGTLQTVSVGGPTTVPLTTALNDLRLLSRMSRLTDTGAVSRNSSQGLAARILGEYNEAVNGAVRSAFPAPPARQIPGGPNAGQTIQSDSPLLEAINQARTYTKQRVALDNIVAQFGERTIGVDGTQTWKFEPMKVYNTLAKPNDQSINLLTDLYQVDRGMVKPLASTLFKELLNRASMGGNEASYSAAKTAESLWRNLGPKTKQLLYGPTLTAEITNFFNSGRYLTDNVNPSGTGPVMAWFRNIKNLMTHLPSALQDQGLEYALGKYLYTAGPGGKPLPYVQNIGQPGWNQLPLATRAAGRTVQGITKAAPVIPRVGVAAGGVMANDNR